MAKDITGHDSRSPSNLKRVMLCPGSPNLIRSMVLPPRSNNIVDENDDEETASEAGTRKHDEVRRVLEGELSSDGLSVDVCWVIDAVRSIEARIGTSFTAVNEHHVNLRSLGIHGGKKSNMVDRLYVLRGADGSVDGVVVIDYKFGVGWVDRPQYNLQLKAYAIGALNDFGGLWALMVKLQPNLSMEDDWYMEHRITKEELDDVALVIKNIVLESKQENAPLCRGDHCTFCRAKEICPQWRDTALSIPMHSTVTAHLAQLSPLDRATLYENVKALKTWAENAADAIAGYAVAEGIEIAGYDVVQGRSTREWCDIYAAEKTIEELCKVKGVDPEKLHVPRSLVSPAKAQEILGKSKVVSDALVPLIASVWNGKMVLAKSRKK